MESMVQPNSSMIPLRRNARKQGKLGEPRASQACQPLSYTSCQSPLSVPLAKTSRWAAPQVETIGPEPRLPTSDSHPFQVVPFHHLCQRALSVPRMRTSRRFALQEATDGSDARTPASVSQADQLVPFQKMCQSALSLAPRVKTSMRLAAQETAAGRDCSVPSSDSHCQEPDEP